MFITDLFGPKMTMDIQYY